jgi:hypothetical protein
LDKYNSQKITGLEVKDSTEVHILASELGNKYKKEKKLSNKLQSMILYFINFKLYRFG